MMIITHKVCILSIVSYFTTTVHPWCDGYSTSISACRVWGARVEIQVFRREFYTPIHLDYARIEILS